MGLIDKNLCRGWKDPLGEELNASFSESVASFEKDIDAAANALSSTGSLLNMAEAIAKIPVPEVPSA